MKDHTGDTPTPEPTGDRGYVGIGIARNKYEVNTGTLIRSARLFGADYVFTVGARYRPQASAVGHDKHIPIVHYPDEATFLDSRPRNAALVAIENTPGATTLPRYTHPERAVYVLGAEDSGVPRPIMRAADATVTIPGLDYSLNVSTAGSIVLYDRSCPTDPANPVDPFGDPPLLGPGGGR